MYLIVESNTVTTTPVGNINTNDGYSFTLFVLMLCKTFSYVPVTLNEYNQHKHQAMSWPITNQETYCELNTVGICDGKVFFKFTRNTHDLLGVTHILAKILVVFNAPYSNSSSCNVRKKSGNCCYTFAFTAYKCHLTK